MDGQDKPRTMPEIRGMPDDERSHAAPPYSALAYAAHYGVGYDQVAEEMEKLKNDGVLTHGEVIRWIRQTYKNRPEVREAARRVQLPPTAIMKDGKPSVRRSSAAKPEITVGDVGDMVRVSNIISPNFSREDINPHPDSDLKKLPRPKLERLIDAAVEDSELDRWLDECIERGDHDLNEDRFIWDDIPEGQRPMVRRLLALRYLEAHEGGGDG